MNYSKIEGTTLLLVSKDAIKYGWFLFRFILRMYMYLYIYYTYMVCVYTIRIQIHPVYLFANHIFYNSIRRNRLTTFFIKFFFSCFLSCTIKFSIFYFSIRIIIKLCTRINKRKQRNTIKMNDYKMHPFFKKKKDEKTNGHWETRT